MKTSKLSKFAWAFFALALGATTVFGQGYRNRNNVTSSQNQACLSQISDLSDEQKSKILGLNNIHQNEMAELRNQRRSTKDALEKNEIRGNMLEKTKAHREDVKILLSENQQKQFEEISTQGKNFTNQKARSGFNRQKGISGKQNCFGKGNSGNFNGCARNNMQQKS